jgi:hypothetical protein
VNGGIGIRQVNCPKMDAFPGRPETRIWTRLGLAGTSVRALRLTGGGKGQDRANPHPGRSQWIAFYSKIVKIAMKSTDNVGYCVLQRHMSSFHLFFQTVQ